MKLYNTGNMKGHLSCYNILESLCKNGTCIYYSEEPVTAVRKTVTKMLFSTIQTIYYISVLSGKL